MEVILFVSNVNLGKYVMFSEVEIFIIGFIGGVIGSGAVILLTSYHYHQVIKDYIKAKIILKEHLNIKSIDKDVQVLKIQIVALQSQFGVNE